METHLLSFEGPDGYARAGGIASRVSGLSRCLADLGFESHLWFVGDPALPGHELSAGVWLHRWCQWISSYHPGGVYDGEEGKVRDYETSLPPFLFEQNLLPTLLAGKQAIVLAEEWQTAGAVIHLDRLLRAAGLRSRVSMFWNANNTFGFDRVDWRRLAEAATITTVSRYMRQLMRAWGVEALVIPNGLGEDAFLEPDPDGVREFRARLQGRMVLGKVARWDPGKRWLGTIAIVRELKDRGWRPLLVAKGGVEAHGEEVLAAARSAGLQIIERRFAVPGTRGLLGAIEDLNGADVVVLGSPLDTQARSVLYRGGHVMLANSAHEPFGLVGLETMAAGGLACTGCSGEDYAVPGRNAIVVQTDEPVEFVRHIDRLRGDPTEHAAIRRAGRETARQYSWREVVRTTLMPQVEA